MHNGIPWDTCGSSLLELRINPCSDQCRRVGVRFVIGAMRDQVSPPDRPPRMTKKQAMTRNAIDVMTKGQRYYLKAPAKCMYAPYVYAPSHGNTGNPVTPEPTKCLSSTVRNSLTRQGPSPPTAKAFRGCHHG